MKKNVLITYGKNRTVNSATIFFTKNNLKLLKITSETKEVIIEYKNDILTIYTFKEGIIDEKYTKGETIIYLKSYLKLEYNKQRSKFQFQIPYEIIKNWNLGENKYVDLKLEKDRLVFKRYKEQKPRFEYSPEYISTRIPIVTIKVITGGIGKTFCACSIGTRLAKMGYKVLILTTDPQNSVLDMLLSYEEEGRDRVYSTYDDKNIIINSETKGLKYWVENGKGETISLRENLDFIPLESFLENNKLFEKNIGKFLYCLKNKYDYILIDSISARGVDKVILNYTKKVIIPCSGDKFTIKGASNVLRDLGAKKVSAIVFNKYLGSIVEKAFYDAMKESAENTTILFPDPIRESSIIKQLVHQGKSIWESSDQRLGKAQVIFQNIIDKLISECRI